MNWWGLQKQIGKKNLRHIRNLSDYIFDIQDVPHSPVSRDISLIFKENWSFHNRVPTSILLPSVFPQIFHSFHNLEETFPVSMLKIINYCVLNLP